MSRRPPAWCCPGAGSAGLVPVSSVGPRGVTAFLNGPAGGWFFLFTQALRAQEGTGSRLAKYLCLLKGEPDVAASPALHLRPTHAAWQCCQLWASASFSPEFAACSVWC